MIGDEKVTIGLFIKMLSALLLDEDYLFEFICVDCLSFDGLV